MIKNVFLIILTLIAIGSVIVAIILLEKTNRATKSLDEERYSRMVAEESLQKSAAKLSTLEAQLKSANQKMANVQDLIEQEKNVNLDLQKQYEELSKLKATLENKLKTAEEEKPVVPVAVP